MVHLAYYTDPCCPLSWAAEPALRRLEVEFSDSVAITYVMAGMAREVDAPSLLASTLEAVASSGMPADPRIWVQGSPRSSHPACLAVKAAAEQGADGPYLRRLRVGVMCLRERLDNAEALVAAARDVPGIDAVRFEIDLRSNAIVEAFAADRDRAARATGPGAERRPGLPAFAFDGGPLLEAGGVDEMRAAAVAAGAEPAAGPPGVEEALHRLGPAGAAELAAVCGLPRARVRVELWRLAGELRARPRELVCGELWVGADA